MKKHYNHTFKQQHTKNLMHKLPPYQEYWKYGTKDTITTPNHWERITGTSTKGNHSKAWWVPHETETETENQNKEDELKTAQQ
jgi:hypothetical protein